MKGKEWTATERARADYAALVGQSEASEREVLSALETAHFVKVQGDGSEIWRGGKPLRLRFVMRKSEEAITVERVQGDHAGRSAPAASRLVVRVGEQTREWLVTDRVDEDSPGRRVAVRLAGGAQAGHWIVGERSRVDPSAWAVVSEPLRNAPDWVRRQRMQPSRRGRDR